MTAGSALAPQYAFGKYDAASHVSFSQNISPQIGWLDLPIGTKSLVLTMHDRDVPSIGTDVNQEGKVVPATLARVDFYHWVLVDIDPAQGELAEGLHSKGVVPRGKPGPQAAGGARAGTNDYVGWFAGDDAMAGEYFNYDGPCPPWNDTIIHHYIFQLYALDIERFPGEDILTGDVVMQVIGSHVLGTDAMEVTYAINPEAV